MKSLKTFVLCNFELLLIIDISLSKKKKWTLKIYILTTIFYNKHKEMYHVYIRAL